MLERNARLVRATSVGRLQPAWRRLRRFLLEIKDIAFAVVVDKIVPRFATEQAFNCLEESLSVEVKQLCQCLLIRQKVNYVECVRLKLALVELTARELFSLQEKTQDPE